MCWYRVRPVSILTQERKNLLVCCAGVKGVWYCLCRSTELRGKVVQRQTELVQHCCFVFTSGWITRLQLGVSSYVTSDCFLKWLIRRISWLETLELAWHHQVMGYERTIKLSFFITGLDQLCPAAWGGAAGTEELRIHHLRYHCYTVCATLFHFHLACFKSLCGVFSLWKFSSDCGVACGDLLASTASLVHIRNYDLGSQVCWDHSGCVALPFHAKGQFWTFLMYKDSRIGALWKALVL